MRRERTEAEELRGANADADIRDALDAEAVERGRTRTRTPLRVRTERRRQQTGRRARTVYTARLEDADGAEIASIEGLSKDAAEAYLTALVRDTLANSGRLRVLCTEQGTFILHYGAGSWRYAITSPQRQTEYSIVAFGAETAEAEAYAAMERHAADYGAAFADYLRSMARVLRVQYGADELADELTDIAGAADGVPLTGYTDADIIRHIREQAEVVRDAIGVFVRAARQTRRTIDERAPYITDKHASSIWRTNAGSMTFADAPDFTDWTEDADERGRTSGGANELAEKRRRARLGLEALADLPLIAPEHQRQMLNTALDHIRVYLSALER